MFMEILSININKNFFEERCLYNIFQDCSQNYLWPWWLRMYFSCRSTNYHRKHFSYMPWIQLHSKYINQNPSRTNRTICAWNNRCNCHKCKENRDTIYTRSQRCQFRKWERYYKLISFHLNIFQIILPICQKIPSLVN